MSQSAVSEGNQSAVLRIRSNMGTDTKQVSIVPTFLLKGIDPMEILKSYINGEYLDQMIPGIKAEVSDNSIIADRAVGNTPESETYEYIDQTNTRRRVITTNHKNYAIVRDGGVIPLGGICMWCRRKFDHESIGVPVKMEKLPNGIIVYHVVYTICSYECNYSMVKLKTQCPMIIRDALLMDSESMLLTMFHSAYPGKRLGESADWTLLECNGGPIPEREYFSEKHTYKKTPNLILLPSKFEFGIDPTLVKVA